MILSGANKPRRLLVGNRVCPFLKWGLSPFRFFAFRCFMGNEIELLVVGNCMLRKSEQNPALKIDYKDEFEPD
jgi:hypothetical protein